MKKITEIYIQKEYLKSERDVFGNRIKTPTIGNFKREPVLAGQGLRLGHYLIDLIIISVIHYFLAILLFAAIPQVMYSINILHFQINIGITVLHYDLFTYMIVILYYFITEITLQRSIGKFATNTVVIDEYGNKPSRAIILTRSFSRIIPFDALSCLSDRGWHDKISRTYVVKKNESQELKRLLSEDELYISDSGDLLD